MCFCVDADSEGLVVLPYNRALRTAAPPATLADRARAEFGGRVLEGRTHEEALAGSDGDHPLVLVTENDELLLEVS